MLTKYCDPKEGGCLPTKDNFERSSRAVTRFDSIIYERPRVGNLSSPYYVGVYANTFTSFRL